MIKNSPDYENVNKYTLTVNAVNNKSAPFYQVKVYCCNELLTLPVRFEIVGGTFIRDIYCTKYISHPTMFGVRFFPPISILKNTVYHHSLK